MESTFHIGRTIKSYVDSHGIRIGCLSKKLLCHRNTIYNLFERDWIDTQTLMRISILLKHDFFAEFSEYYRCHVEDDDDQLP